MRSSTSFRVSLTALLFALILSFGVSLPAVAEDASVDVPAAAEEAAPEEGVATEEDVAPEDEAAADDAAEGDVEESPSGLEPQANEQLPIADGVYFIETDLQPGMVLEGRKTRATRGTVTA